MRFASESFCETDAPGTALGLSLRAPEWELGGLMPAADGGVTGGATEHGDEAGEPSGSGGIKGRRMRRIGIMEQRKRFGSLKARIEPRRGVDIGSAQQEIGLVEAHNPADQETKQSSRIWLTPPKGHAGSQPGGVSAPGAAGRAVSGSNGATHSNPGRPDGFHHRATIPFRR